jgi:hypothetical protein
MVGVKSETGSPLHRFAVPLPSKGRILGAALSLSPSLRVSAPPRELKKVGFTRRRGDAQRKWLEIAALLLATIPLPAFADGHIARLGQTISVEGPRVRPLTVVEDSRCPMEARCVWAGRVRIKVRIIGGKQSFIREMEVGKPLQLFDGTLMLDNVMPPRHTGKPMPSRAYRFEFSFSGGL